ncbi:hypothetical protein LJD21_10690, partial [Pseudomonas inefficax]|uniref:hypothetical protein n=1 Tax=Pseudomonas inefficax TaxID=2078786 RepID=UPI00207BCA51
QPWPDRFGTLQQMWERACPAKRRAGGARSHKRSKCNGKHSRSAARAALGLTGNENTQANIREAPSDLTGYEMPRRKPPV